jgi:hypothetical protein
LLNTFLQWRDHPACSHEARAFFNELADTVVDVSREGLQLYLSMELV